MICKNPFMEGADTFSESPTTLLQAFQIPDSTDVLYYIRQASVRAYGTARRFAPTLPSARDFSLLGAVPQTPASALMSIHFIK